jgi:hypothetical protein
MNSKDSMVTNSVVIDAFTGDCREISALGCAASIAEVVIRWRSVRLFTYNVIPAISLDSLTPQTHTMIIECYPQSSSKAFTAHDAGKISSPSVFRCFSDAVRCTPDHAARLGLGPLGHRVISLLAERHLTTQAKAAIKELLEPGESLADASLWADENRGRLPKTARSRIHGIVYQKRQTVRAR